MALAAAPQLPELILHFRSDRWNQVRFGHYPFLSVTYSGKNWGYNPVALSGVPLINKWEIEVNPVPRTVRHRIQHYILDSALPQIRQWLDQRADLAHDGTDTLGFFFETTGTSPSVGTGSWLSFWSGHLALRSRARKSLSTSSAT
jgi:hypothetical protein